MMTLRYDARYIAVPRVLVWYNQSQGGRKWLSKNPRLTL